MLNQERANKAIDPIFIYSFDKSLELYVHLIEK